MNFNGSYTGIAPGRLDVMGGIADYSGGLVLQMPLNLYTRVNIKWRADNRVHIQSAEGKVEVDIAPLLEERGRIVEGQSWDTWSVDRWALYILGCLFVLLDERDFVFRGMDINVDSEVPIGKGVSSSAALEVATMRALYQAFGLPPEREALAVMAQKAENYVAGAPCGIMDQMAVHLGRKDTLLPILCQPYTLFQPLSIPAGLQFFGLDTGVRHAVGDGVYGRVRTAAFMGFKMIQKHLESQRNYLPWQESGTDQSFSPLPYKGYLANIPVAVFEKSYASLLPHRLSGSDYLSQYPKPSGVLNTVEVAGEYPVYAATKHPVYEHQRIRQFKRTLEDENADPVALGQWMLESHQGYVDCGLSCLEADAIVAMVCRRIDKGNVFGARITGGGSGGTVCILARSAAAVREIKSEYEATIGRSVMLFSGSGDGAFYK